jgi:hypothetical protein
MYKYYIYPLDGGTLTITVTDLPAGVYDVLAYSADGNLELSTAGVSHGVKRTYAARFANPLVWVEGRNYARFQGIAMTGDQSLLLMVRPGRDRYAIISGMQIIGRCYSRDSAWALSGTSSGNNGAASEYRGRAEWFVPEISGRLSSIEAAIQSSGAGPLNFSIAEDAGEIPGRVLERFPNVQAPARGDNAPLLTLKSRVHPVLRAGVKYWFCAEPARPATLAWWFPTDQSVTNNFAFDRSPSLWTSAPPGAGNAQEPIQRNGAFAVTLNPDAGR